MATSEPFRANFWHPRWWPFLARAVLSELRLIEIVVTLR